MDQNMATRGQILKSLGHYNMHDGGNIATKTRNSSHLQNKSDFKDKVRLVFKVKTL